MSRVNREPILSLNIKLGRSRGRLRFYSPEISSNPRLRDFAIILAGAVIYGFALPSAEGISAGALTGWVLTQAQEMPIG